MSWNIAQAKQHFSEVVRASGQEPQRIFNRNQLVAVVLSAADMAAFETWQRQSAKRSLAEEFAEVRQLLEQEAYELAVPPRADRANAFAQMLEEEGHDAAA